MYMHYLQSGTICLKPTCNYGKWAILLIRLHDNSVHLA